MQKWYEKVFHVASNAGDEVQTPLSEFLEEMLGDIAFVAYEPALQRGCYGVEGFAIIRIARCHFGRHDFTFVVDPKFSSWSLIPASLGRFFSRNINPLKTDCSLKASHQIG